MMDTARVADTLTSLRVVLVPVMAWLIGTRRLDAAAVALGAAWSTDFLDGRMARRSASPTRLNGWDLRVDSWLAVGQGIGVGVGGYFSWWIVAPLASAVVLGSVTMHNPAPVMVGIGALTGLFIWVVLFEAQWWWLPVVYGGVLLVADWHRFWRVIMPALWHGTVSLVRGERHSDRRLVADEWVE